MLLKSDLPRAALAKQIYANSIQVRLACAIRFVLTRSVSFLTYTAISALNDQLAVLGEDDHSFA